MIITQQCNTGQYVWSSSKLAAFHQKPASPRMSNREQMKTQPDWRDQYSQYLPLSENTILPPLLDQGINFNSTENSTPERQSEVTTLQRLGNGLEPVGNRRDVPQLLDIDRQDLATEQSGNQSSNGPGQDPVDSAGPDDHLLGPGSLAPPPHYLQPSTQTSRSQGGHLEISVPKEGEEEEYDEDDDMVDLEIEGGPSRTDAERRAERRKMKRFRLTHQQTRFLMSEFAKQAHPDAAHRERLSKEIPGLSPRQVQVWFQNRRAKIKRLTADDRERMLKMRAVPENFDNVQALHSPYGAVHVSGTPLQSPVDYSSSYGEQVMLRPLNVGSVRRLENEEQHMSSTGLSLAYGQVGFPPQSPMGAPDALSPLPVNSGDRFYGSQLSSPMSTGPRSANSFNHQSNSDGYQGHLQSRHPRPLQPLQIRETMSRTRSQSLQSPLRSSMSWKGDALDYGDYPVGSMSPTLTARQQAQYQPDQAVNNSGSGHFDTTPYANANFRISPTHNAYHTSQPASLQSLAATPPRYRSSSAVFPSSLDLNVQYRALASQQMNTRGGAPSTSLGTSFNSSFAATSAGFPSAPLSAPSDFQLPRTLMESGSRDYQMSQMSAPMAPPQDFETAYNQIASSSQVTQSERGLHNQQSQHQQTESSLQDQSTDNTHDGFETTNGHGRKRTYSIPLAFEGR